MTSLSRRRSDENTSRSSFPAKGAHFFKIIVDNQKMRIPKKFIRKYGNNLSNPVFLKVPSGAVWTVELVHSDGDVWLQNGWQEFKEYYSIDHGHFLVFRYDGNSHFHVLIFDLSGTEIEYPFSDIHVEQTNNNVGYEMPNTDGIEVDDSDEILNDFPACQTREIIKECIGGMASTPRHLHTKAPEGRRRGGRASAEKDIALQRAKAYKSEDPFFMVFMQPSYVTARFILCVPLVFAGKYFADKQDIVLRVSDGRTWSVKCNFSKTNAKISGGWQSFVEDNNLKVGDVCVFQLINGIEPSLKVIIF